LAVGALLAAELVASARSRDPAPVPLRTRLQASTMRELRFAAKKLTPLRVRRMRATGREFRYFDGYREMYSKGRLRELSVGGLKIRVPRFLEGAVVTRAVGDLEGESGPVAFVDVVTDDLQWRRLFSDGKSLYRLLGQDWVSGREGFDDLSDRQVRALVDLTFRYKIP
jgi:hypothetical protein